MTVSRRPIDRNASVQQRLAELVDVIDLVGEVAEIASLPIFLRVPVVSELDLRIVIARRGEKQIADEIADVEQDAQAARGRSVQMGMYERSVETYRMLHDSLLQRYRDMASQADSPQPRIS